MRRLTTLCTDWKRSARLRLPQVQLPLSGSGTFWNSLRSCSTCFFVPEERLSFAKFRRPSSTLWSWCNRVLASSEVFLKNSLYCSSDAAEASACGYPEGGISDLCKALAEAAARAMETKALARPRRIAMPSSKMPWSTLAHREINFSTKSHKFSLGFHSRSWNGGGVKFVWDLNQQGNDPYYIIVYQLYNI